MAGNSKANIDNVWAFLDDILTPDSQNVAQRQKTERIKATTKTNLGGTVQKVAEDVTDFGTTVVKETAGVAKGGLTLAGNANEQANETVRAGLGALGTPGGQAAATGLAMAFGGPPAAAAANAITGALGGAPAPAAPTPAAPAPTTFPGTPKEDNTGKVVAGVAIVGGILFAIVRGRKNA